MLLRKKLKLINVHSFIMYFLGIVGLCLFHSFMLTTRLSSLQINLIHPLTHLILPLICQGFLKIKFQSHVSIKAVSSFICTQCTICNNAPQCISNVLHWISLNFNVQSVTVSETKLVVLHLVYNWIHKLPNTVSERRIKKSN